MNVHGATWLVRTSSRSKNVDDSVAHTRKWPQHMARLVSGRLREEDGRNEDEGRAQDASRRVTSLGSGENDFLIGRLQSLFLAFPS